MTEFTSPGFNPEEDDDEEESKDKPSAKSFGLETLFKKPEGKEEKKAAEIGQSLFGLGEKKEEQTEEKEKTGEESGEMGSAEAVLTPEEEEAALRRYATEHIEHPVTNEAPTEPVEEFLKGVEESGDPDEELVSVTTEFELTEMIDLPLETTVEDDNAVPTTPSSAMSGTLFSRRRPTATQLPQNQPVPPPIPPTVPPPLGPKRTPSTESGPKTPVPAFFAGELAGYIIGKRKGRAEGKKEALSEKKKVENRLSELETSLKDTELRLQQAALKKRSVKTENIYQRRAVTPPERTKPGLSETRLGLDKPKSVEHIGKVVMTGEQNKEKISKTGAGVKPEQVQTLRREDLLDLAEKIKVEGASLKSMFDSNLFGERALRRLVTHYLRGENIAAELRREIIERQIDYERDPQLRDLPHEDSDSLSFEAKPVSSLERLLETAGALPVKDAMTLRAEAAAEKAKEPKEKSELLPLLGRKAQVSSAATLTLGFVIFILIVLIAFLMIHGY